MSEETFRLVVAGGVVLAAVCFVVQAIVTLTIASGLKRTQVRVTALIERSEPVVDKTRRLLEENAPKITAIIADAAEMVKRGKEETERLSELVKDFSERAKVQVARIDGAVDHTVDQVQTATDAMRNAVLRPVREVNGLFSGVRTALFVYMQGRRESVDHATQDEEMFI